MIDMHCHIIPKVDDGSKSIDISIEMGRLAKECGYNAIFATSHYIIHDNETENNEYMQKINELNEKLKEENVDLQIYPGNEVFFTNNILELIQEKKICTLANSKYILVELPLFTKVIPLNVYDEFNRLQDAGYVPILAHPERYEFVSEDINTIVKLIEAGVLMQSNIASIGGKYGRHAKKNIKKMLKYNMVHLLGSDSHSTSVYENYNKYIEKIKKVIKDEKIISDILVENPNKVLNNEKIDIIYPNIKK